MSSWASRLGNLGRFSPFTRSPPHKTEVSDADFSYITKDDLLKHQREQDAARLQSQSQSQQRTEEPVDLGPARDTDRVVVRNKKESHAVHFPAYSIAKGELSVGALREGAAKKLGHDARRIKLLYKGTNLKDDSRTCRSVGLKDGSELMCTIGEAPSPSDSDGSASDDDIAMGREGDDDESRRRRRNRNKNKKRRDKRKEQKTSGTSTPDPQANSSNLRPPPQTSTPTTTSRAHSPVKQPQGPREKMTALRETLLGFVSQCDDFRRNPPSDPAKKDFEHKRLSETILTQVLLKLDAVETEGDEEARAQRKALVKETQAVLKGIDESVK